MSAADRRVRDISMPLYSFAIYIGTRHYYDGYLLAFNNPSRLRLVCSSVYRLLGQLPTSTITLSSQWSTFIRDTV